MSITRTAAKVPKLIFDHVVRHDGGYLLGYPEPDSRVVVMTTAQKKFVTAGATAFTRHGAEKFASLLNERSKWPTPYEAVHIETLPSGVFWNAACDIAEEKKALGAFELPLATGWRADLMFIAEARPSLDEIEERFRSLARKHHPDAGGDREKFEAITRARDAAKKEIAGGRL